MKDPEFVKLRNKFLFAVFIGLLFTVPLLIFVSKTYSSSNVLNKIIKGKTFTILVVNSDCDMCNSVDEILDNSDVDYLVLDKSTNKDYDEIMNKLTIVNKREKFPIVVYVEEGKMKAYLTNITNDDLVNQFLESHSLVNSK